MNRRRELDVYEDAEILVFKVGRPRRSRAFRVLLLASIAVNVSGALMLLGAFLLLPPESMRISLTTVTALVVAGLCVSAVLLVARFLLYEVSGREEISFDGAVLRVRRETPWFHTERRYRMGDTRGLRLVTEAPGRRRWWYSLIPFAEAYVPERLSGLFLPGLITFRDGLFPRFAGRGLGPVDAKFVVDRLKERARPQ